MRSKRRWNRLAALSIGGPALVIAAGWVGLWFLWPTGAMSGIASRHMPAPRACFMPMASVAESLYMDPSLFGPSAILGFRPIERKGRTVRNLPEPGGRRNPRFLEPASGADTPAKPGPVPAVSWDLPAGTYRPVWPAEGARPLSTAATNGPRLTIRMDERLADRGLQVSSLPASRVRNPEKAWLIGASVEVDANGRVRHVFLDQRAEDPEVNAMAVRMLYTSSVAKPGAPCYGKVWLNYGTP